MEVKSNLRNFLIFGLREKRPKTLDQTCEQSHHSRIVHSSQELRIESF